MRVSMLVSAATLLCVWLTCEAKTIGSTTTTVSRVSEEGVAEGRRQATPQPEDGQDLKDARCGDERNNLGMVECGQTATLMPGDVVEFQSENYPNPYSNGHLCTWTFQASDPNDTLAVDCDTFHVEADYDFVIFIEPTAPAGTEFKITGDLGSFMTTTMTGLVEITFDTDFLIKKPGFHCTVYIPEGESGISKARIVGGVAAPEDKYSWQVAIFDHQDDFVCSGSLVSSTHVLTAAHCVDSDAQYQVLVGSHTIPDAADRTYVSVSQKTIHEDYDSATRANDMALLQLADPQSNVDSVCMSEIGDAKRNSRVFVSGWEAEGDGGLMEVEVPLVPPRECRYNYTSVDFNVTEHMMCAGAEGKGICQDDGGAPLVVGESGLIGIATHAEGCDDSQYPGVYTRVYAYARWIKHKVGDAACFI